MNFLVDAQLPPLLAQWLREQGHLADHVADIGLCEAEDTVIWQYALAHAACILTKDEDFAARAQHSPHAPMIVWLRIGNCSNSTLRDWFFPLLPDVLRELAVGQRFIEVR